MSEAATVVVSSLLGGAVAFTGAVVHEVFGARRQIDEALRTKRLDLYKELWQKGVLHRGPHAADDAVDPDEYETVRRACSGLRSALTRDLTSRRGRSGLL